MSRRSQFLVALLLSSLAPASALANANPGNAPCGRHAGYVWERGEANKLLSWEISATGPRGEVIHTFTATGTTNDGGAVKFNVAQSYGGVPVCDASNKSVATPVAEPGGGPGGGKEAKFPRRFRNAINPYPEPNPNPPVDADFGNGATSILELDSYWTDTDGIWWHEGMFARVELVARPYPYVHVPDLFADTNGDGVIGDGDILYSLVDMFTFLLAPPIFSLGDSFYIADGRVAELPGMYFSPTPIILDPMHGPVPSGGEWFNPSPVIGPPPEPNGWVLSAHTIDAPAPASLALLGLGLGLAALARRHTPGRAWASLP